MSILQKFIEELKEYELINHENQHYTNLLTVQDAVDVLQRFEIALINELDYEQLLNLKNGIK